MKEPEKKPEDQKNERRKRLEVLAASLLRKRDEAVRFRAASGVERRWREDQQAFDGIDEQGKGSAMIDYATGEAAPRGNTGPVRSRAQVNMVRPKCETAEGRFCDILLPVDDKNWGLKVTPVPELVKGIKDDRPVIDTTTGQPLEQDGKQVKTSDIVRAKMSEAKKRMHRMEDEIDDQLTECSYNSECRKVVRSAVRLGTGVLKGPQIVKAVKKSWTPQTDAERTVHVLEVIEDSQPASKAVDIWNVFPDPQCGEDVSRASYIWEYDEILPRELRSLLGLDGYFSDQIESVLLEDPQRTSAGISKDNSYEIRKQALDKGYAYELWEYHGDVDRDDLEALGVDPGELKGRSLSACVVFVNERPIKIQLHVLDTGDVIYDFFQWTQTAGSPWGIGVARMSIWWNKIIRAAWRSILDNARDSAGANVVIGKGLEPVDGRHEITGKKLWKYVGDLDDVRKVFAQFQIETRQAELQAIIELALKFLDIETNLPMLFQGEKSESIPDVLGIVDVMVDSSNVALRTRVKLWDDAITSKHIRRYYDWNMQYNDKEEIKGDYNVDPRGASILLAKDQQARALIQILNLKGNPDIDAETDWRKALKQLYDSLRLDILKSEEDKQAEAEQQAQQPPPQDPRIEAANIKVQGEMQRAEMNQQADMSELEFKAQEAEKQRQHDIALRTMEHEIELMRFSQETGMQLNEIKADLAQNAAKMNLQRELSEKKAEGPQVLTPVVEPRGRAKDGRAFQE